MAGRLAIASLNIHGVPFSRPPATVRAARIGELAGQLDLDVLCVQEVHTYPVLRALAAALPSLPYPGHVPGAARPSGGLVTFTKEPAARTTFRPLPAPARPPAPAPGRTGCAACSTPSAAMACWSPSWPGPRARARSSTCISARTGPATGRRATGTRPSTGPSSPR